MTVQAAIDAMFERLGRASDVDLMTLAADDTVSPGLAAARETADRVVRQSRPAALAAATERLRAWGTDAGSFPPAGVAAQTMNIGQLELRARALPAIHDALLSRLAADGLDPEDASALSEAWDRIEGG